MSPSRWKIAGLRLGRLSEWLDVLDAGHRSPGFRGWMTMLRLLATLPWRKVDARQIRSDYRQCLNCPIRDPLLNRCGDGMESGCNCYIPYSVSTGKHCWIRSVWPESDYGYPRRGQPSLRDRTTKRTA